MNKKTKKELYNNFPKLFNEYSEDLLDIDPDFSYKGKRIRLDFVSKTDHIFLKKVFAELEKSQNDKVDFDVLKKEAVKEFTDEQKMKKIQAKKYITTKEMEEIYNISVSSQKDYRGRLNDPLPFNQKIFRGKITYTVEDIEKWLKNQNK